MTEANHPQTPLKSPKKPRPGGQKAGGALTPKRKAFCLEYLIDNNATQAAIRAGFKETNARVVAAELLTMPCVQDELDRLRAERSARTEITADMVLAKWWDIANANPNDLTQWRQLNCRHCHGKDHAYQWDEQEFIDALAEHCLAKESSKDYKGKAPVAVGGYGWNAKADPNPACPKCKGEGIGQPHILDTRKLKGGAALLYAGLEVTNNGIKIKTHDQMKALENVARHLGMFTEKHELTGKNGDPLAILFGEVLGGIDGKSAGLPSDDDGGMAISQNGPA
jgi:phage terminase small subunit